MDACQILFGDAAQARYNEYFGAREQAGDQELRRYG